MGIARNDADFFVPEYGLVGLRPCDSHEVSQLNELKIDTTFILEVQHVWDLGAILMIEQMPIVGGYVGTVEQASISNVATHLASFGMFGASYHLDGPVHVRWGITTAREALQVAGHTARAIDANLDVLIANQYYPLAGPCTEMCLLETAAQTITDACSGRELASGVASAKGVAEDYTTGIEARVMGEVAIAATKLSPEQANEVLNNILALYEKNYKEYAVMGGKGKKFHECYDTVKIVPTEEHLKVYENAMKKLEECGVPLQGIW